MYTNISKPTGTPYTNINKAPTEIALYGSAIYGVSRYGVVSNYTNVSKPVGTPYTNISKPT